MGAEEVIKYLPRFIVELMYLMADDEEKRERFHAELERRSR
jgi:hypothetical protein